MSETLVREVSLAKASLSRSYLSEVSSRNQEHRHYYDFAACMSQLGELGKVERGMQCRAREDVSQP